MGQSKALARVGPPDYSWANLWTKPVLFALAVFPIGGGGVLGSIWWLCGSFFRFTWKIQSTHQIISLLIGTVLAISPMLYSWLSKRELD